MIVWLTEEEAEIVERLRQDTERARQSAREPFSVREEMLAGLEAWRQDRRAYGLPD